MEGAAAPVSGRTVTFADVVSSYRALLGPWMKKLAPVYLLLALGMMIVSVPGWIVGYVQLEALATGDFATMATLGLVSGLVRFVSAFAIVAIVAIRIGLSRSIRAILVDGPDAVAGPSAAFADAKKGFWSIVGITLVCGVAIGVGMVLCILPGLAAMFLLLAAPYLVAVGASDFGSSFQRSYELTTKNTGPLIGVLLTVAGTMAVLIGLSFGLRYVLTMSFGLAAAMFAEPVTLLLAEAAGLFWWPFVGAALVTVETAYRGVPLRK